MKRSQDLDRSPCLVAWLALLAPALLAACKLEYTMEEFDRLARETEARTILLEEDLSLYSPYDWVQTHEYAELVRKQRIEVFALLGIEHAGPTVVVLRPNAGIGSDVHVEGNQVEFRGLSFEPHGGFYGWASGNLVNIEVDPPRFLRLENGRTLGSQFSASMYERTIRHELTHAALFLLGLEQNGWLHEGMARAVASTPIADGRFRPEPADERLRAAAAIPHERRSLEWLLDWRQGVPPGEDDRIAGALGHSLVLFLLERDGAPSLREGFARVAALERASILALEPEWSAWLERSEPAPAAPSPTP